MKKTWHDSHKETSTFGQRLADKVADGMGSWYFIIVQSLLVLTWMGLNFLGYVNHWDPYPFILLNLLFSTHRIRGDRHLIAAEFLGAFRKSSA